MFQRSAASQEALPRLYVVLGVLTRSASQSFGHLRWPIASGACPEWTKKAGRIGVEGQAGQRRLPIADAKKPNARQDSGRAASSIQAGSSVTVTQHPSNACVSSHAGLLTLGLVIKRLSAQAFMGVGSRPLVFHVGVEFLGFESTLSGSLQPALERSYPLQARSFFFRLAESSNFSTSTGVLRFPSLTSKSVSFNGNHSIALFKGI